MTRIYFDHAATTPLSATVLAVMMPYLTEHFGNASSLYREGQISRTAIDDARLDIANIIDCNLDEIIFTSGATESNNLALKGVIESYIENNKNSKNSENSHTTQKIPEIISSPLEHSSLKKVLEYFVENSLATVQYCSVDSDGMVDPEEIRDLITENTALVTVMAVNNEIGSIQPISRIGRLCEKKEIPFHVDAVQAFGQIKTSVLYWKCDLMSLSAHKLYGPKGVGLLYVKHGTEICEQMLGGGQERSYRSGTENIPAIVGFAKAMQESENVRETEFSRIQKLQILAHDFLKTKFSGLGVECKFNGPEISENSDASEKRVVNNIHFSLPDIDGESLLMRLDLEGVSISLGSACSAGMIVSSHVLESIGCTEEESQSGVRLTFGRKTTEEILMKGLEKIVEVVKDLHTSRGFFD